jgi:hypothetical protein
MFWCMMKIQRVSLEKGGGGGGHEGNIFFGNKILK